MREEVEELKKELNEVKEQSFAYELLRDSTKDKKRFFYMWLVTFIAFIGLLGYTLWLLNDIGIVEETTQEITDFDTINGSVVNKGDINGEN